MTFAVVEGTKRVAAVISMATVSRVGEKHIVVLVVANPLATTLGLDESSAFAAQPAAWGVRIQFF
jgi:hypothetical protein